MLDIMMSDLPRVQYGDRKITSDDMIKANKRTEEIRMRVKSGGLGLSLSNQVDSQKFISENRES